jgi:hypothetical protein
MIDSIKTTRDFAKAMKELQSLTVEAGDTFSTELDAMRTRIGQTKDQFSDLNDSISFLSASPVENLTNSFGGMGIAIRNLDFGGATNAAKAFNQSLANFKVNDLIKEFGTFLVTLGTLGKVQTANTVATKTATTATKLDTAAKVADTAVTEGLTVATEAATVATYNWNAALKGTVILAIVAAVIALIANFDKLKEIGGGLGNLFSAISNSISSIVQGMKDFLDQIGLTNFAAQDAAKKRQRDEEKSAAALEDRIKQLSREIEMYNAAGKSAQAYYTEVEKTRLEDALIQQKTIEKQRELNEIRSKVKPDLDKQTAVEKELNDLYNQRMDLLNKMGVDWRKQYDDANAERKKLDEENERIAANSIKNETERTKRIAQINRKYRKEETDNEYGDLLLAKEALTDRLNEIDKKLNPPFLYNGQPLSKLSAEEYQKLVVQYDDLRSNLLLIDKQIANNRKENENDANEYSAILRESRLKQIQKDAQAEIDNYKRVFDQIDRDQSMSVENRKIAEKALLNDQIAFIEKNIDKLFPKDPNKSNAAAAEEQVGKARAAVAGLQKQVEDIDTDSVKRQKEAADSRLTSEAKIMGLRAKSIQEVHAAEIANLESKFASETKIVDFRNMTAEEIVAYEKAEEARRLQFETDLGALKLKQQEELTQKKLGDMEREAEFLSSKAKTGGAFNIGQQLEALDKEHALKLEQMNAQMQKEIDVVGTTEAEKQQIREFYAQKEEELAQQTQEAKLSSIKEGIDKGAALAEQGMKLASAIEEIVRNNNRKNLKEGEVLSEKIQKREFNSQKALGIVSVGIDTAKGIGAALPLIPANPVYAKILMALIAATGLAQIGAIQSQRFTPETGSGSGTTLSNIGDIPSTEQTNISTPTLFGLGQFNPTNFPGNQQQRVYVLESDITRAQSNVKQVQVSANF